MQKYINNVQDTFGNAIGSVTVTIRDNPGGGLSTIFSDNAGSAKSNPFTNDADGEFFFYAADGRYDIELTGPITETKADIRLLDILTSGTSIRINADLNTATPPTTEAVRAQLLYYDLANNDEIAAIGFEGSNVFRVNNRMRGGNLELRAQTSAGSNNVLFSGDADGGVSLYYAGSRRFAVQTGGTTIYSSGNTDSDADRRVLLSWLNGTLRGYVGHGTSDLRLENQIHGGDVQLRGEDTGGTGRLILTGDPDGQTILYNIGVAVAATNTTGRFSVLSVGNTDTEGRFLNLTYQNQTVRGGIGYNANDILLLRNLVHGGNVQLTGEDAGGTTRTFLTGDPDGETNITGDTDVKLKTGAGAQNSFVGVAAGKASLYYNNQENLRTAAEAGSDIGMGAEVRHNDDSFYPVGMNVLPEESAIDSGNETLAQNNVGKMIHYNTGTARSLHFNNDSAIKVGATWAVMVGPSAGTLTGDGGTGVIIRWWNGTGWTSTAAAGNITIGVGQYTIWKETDTLFHISGPTLS